MRNNGKRRSGCPVGLALDTLGDRWTMLIVRDLMVRGVNTFKEFQESGERIASNVLAERLDRLQKNGIVAAEQQSEDRRRIAYRLTAKGIDLAPALLELFLWGAKHEPSTAPSELIRTMENNREKLLMEVRRRWRENDKTPLIPRFQSSSTKEEANR